MLTSPRVYCAMARDRLFFQRWLKCILYSKRGFAFIAGAVWSAAAPSPQLWQLLTYVVSSAGLLALAAALIFGYRRRAPDAGAVPRAAMLHAFTILTPPPPSPEPIVTQPYARASDSASSRRRPAYLLASEGRAFRSSKQLEEE